MFPARIIWPGSHPDTGELSSVEVGEPIDAAITQGFFLKYAENKGPHQFCGEHRIPGADCPNCNKPLLRYASLDLEDPLLQTLKTQYPQPTRWLHLLFCWNCPILAGIVYKQHDDERIELLQYLTAETYSLDGPGTVYPYQDHPYENYPDHFPLAASSLEPLDPQFQALIHEFNTSDDPYSLDIEDLHCQNPQHQIGGEPMLIQDLNVPICPECMEPMQYLACFADENRHRSGFTENCGVQVIFSTCTACRTFYGMSYCD